MKNRMHFAEMSLGQRYKIDSPSGLCGIHSRSLESHRRCSGLALGTAEPLLKGSSVKQSSRKRGRSVAEGSWDAGEERDDVPPYLPASVDASVRGHGSFVLATS